MDERVDRIDKIMGEIEEIEEILDHSYRARRQLEDMHEEMETADVEDEDRFQVAHMIVTLGSLEHKWSALLTEKKEEARRA